MCRDSCWPGVASRSRQLASRIAVQSKIGNKSSTQGYTTSHNTHDGLLDTRVISSRHEISPWHKVDWISTQDCRFPHFDAHFILPNSTPKSRTKYNFCPSCRNLVWFGFAITSPVRYRGAIRIVFVGRFTKRFFPIIYLTVGNVRIEKNWI